MRALLLTALLATAAAAQDAPPSVPFGDQDRCDAPDAMPTPFEAAEGAAAVEVTFDGPAPVPMPNLCGEPAALAEAGPASVPPAAYLLPPDDVLRERYPQYFRLLEDGAGGARPALPPSEPAPVAPDAGRE